MALVSKKITAELATASRIKSSANRKAVTNALKTIQVKLKELGNKAPSNGIAIFSGLVKSRMTIELIVPPFKLKQSSYLCDARFHTEMLREGLMSIAGPAYGIAVVDGKGAYLGLVQGTRTRKLCSISYELPSKHNKGGQSQNRFQNGRAQARVEYRKILQELLCKTFIGENHKANVEGLILAGSAGVKHDMRDGLDERLSCIVLKEVTVSYGGRVGMDEALNKVSHLLSKQPLLREKALLESFYASIAREDDLTFYGMRETQTALEMGAVSTLFVSKQLIATHKVYEVARANGNSSHIVCTPHQLQARLRRIRASPANVSEPQPLLPFLKERACGATIEVIGSSSAESRQFSAAFQIGGMLRWKRASIFYHLDESEEDEEEEDEFM